MKQVFYSSIILFSLFSSFMFAQKLEGKVIYFSKKSMKSISFTADGMTEEQKNKIMDKMAKIFEKNFELSFTSYESICQEEEKLETQTTKVGTSVTANINNPRFYKNLKSNVFIKEEVFFDKEFLIKDTLIKHNWIITNEQKRIGNYLCTKAKIITPVTKEDLEDYEKSKALQDKSGTDFFKLEQPAEKVTEAWFTAQIPIQNGPLEFGGLPGLILELHYGDTTLLCTKVTLNPEKKIVIKLPKRGKVVSQTQFNEIEAKKYKSLENEDGVIEINSN